MGASREPLAATAEGLVAAQHAWLASASRESLDSYIDRAMAAIRP
jgi:hypothetical protein